MALLFRILFLISTIYHPPSNFLIAFSPDKKGKREKEKKKSEQYRRTKYSTRNTFVKIKNIYISGGIKTKIVIIDRFFNRSPSISPSLCLSSRLLRSISFAFERLSLTAPIRDKSILLFRVEREREGEGEGYGVQKLRAVDRIIRGNTDSMGRKISDVRFSRVEFNVSCYPLIGF